MTMKKRSLVFPLGLVLLTLGISLLMSVSAQGASFWFSTDERIRIPNLRAMFTKNLSVFLIHGGTKLPARGS